MIFLRPPSTNQTEIDGGVHLDPVAGYGAGHWSGDGVRSQEIPDLVLSCHGSPGDGVVHQEVPGGDGGHGEVVVRGLDW